MKNTFVKITLILVVTLSTFTSCKDKEETPTDLCTIANPLEDIDWLKDMHTTFQISQSPQATKIIQYNYNGECVFLIDSCVNCDDGSQEVYNEQQELICQFGTIAGLNTCPDFFDEATFEVILWEG